MIIPRHEYERLKNDLHLAKLVIKLKNEKIASQEKIIEDLIKNKTVLVDFPATKKLHEDKSF